MKRALRSRCTRSQSGSSDETEDRAASRRRANSTTAVVDGDARLANDTKHLRPQEREQYLDGAVARRRALGNHLLQSRHSLLELRNLLRGFDHCSLRLLLLLLRALELLLRGCQLPEDFRDGSTNGVFERRSARHGSS